jgi:dynein heavy chain
LLDKSWLAFLEMSSRFEVFKGFDDDFVSNLEKWEEIYNNVKPQSGKLIWPNKWASLPLLQKTIVMSILRADKVIPMLQKIVKKQPELGKAYITPPSNDMEEIFDDSTNKQPIMIVLSPGADPMTDIRNLSNLKKIKFESLSLG